MPQTKMETTFTLFPDKVALVPLDAIAGSSPTIESFADITKSNSFVLNDASADTDLIVSEDGIGITYTKTSDSVQAFDAGGLGDLDDVTTERQLSLEIGVNGFSHDIWAILMGLDPTTAVEDHFKFNKTDTTGVEAAGLRMEGNIKKEKFFFIARVPLDDQDNGDLYLASPKIVIEDQDVNVPMQNQKVTHTLPFKGLKMVNSSQLSTLQEFSEAIVNGYELLFAWNAADEAYVA